MATRSVLSESRPKGGKKSLRMAAAAISAFAAPPTTVYYQPLVNHGAEVGLTPAMLREAARLCKSEGNAAFKGGDYPAALEAYRDAITALLEQAPLLRSLKAEERARLADALSDSPPPEPAPEPEPDLDDDRGALPWTLPSTDSLIRRLDEAVSDKERKHAAKDAEPADRALLVAMHSNGSEALHRIGEYEWSLKWAQAGLAVDPTHKKCKQRLAATQKNKTRLSARVAEAAWQKAGSRNQQHAAEQRALQQATAQATGRRETITNSQKKKDRAPAAAAERERLEAAIAAASRAEHRKQEKRRLERAARAASRLREIQNAPPLGSPRDPVWAQNPGKPRPQSAPATAAPRDVGGVSAFCASGRIGNASRRFGTQGFEPPPDGFLNMLFKPSRAADAAARVVCKDEGRSRGALNKEAARAVLSAKRNATSTVVGEKNAKERVAVVQKVQQRVARRAEKAEECGARHVLQSYSSQDEIRGVANKGKRERAAGMAATRCRVTAWNRDRRSDAGMQRALAGLAGGGSEQDLQARAKRRAAVAAAKAAAAEERQRQIEEAHAHQRELRAEKASGTRKVSNTKAAAAANAMNKARDGQPIFNPEEGVWKIHRAAGATG